MLKEIHGDEESMADVADSLVHEAERVEELERHLIEMLAQQAKQTDDHSTALLRVTTVHGPFSLTEIPLRLPLSKLIEAKRAEMADLVERITTLVDDLEDAANRVMTFFPAQVVEEVAETHSGGREFSNPPYHSKPLVGPEREA